ncbi:ATP-binding protein [Patescibacteria group bacterium]
MIGNKKVQEIIYRQIDKGFLPHANLFTGPDHLGKFLLAKELGNYIVCRNRKGNGQVCNKCIGCQINEKSNLSQVIIVSPNEDTNLISINEIRSIIKEQKLTKPFSLPSVIIINDADKLSESAANSMLKILEEPPNKTYFFIITSKLNHIPKTIASRCQLMYFKKVKKSEIVDYLKNNTNYSTSEISELARYSLGLPGKVIEWKNNHDMFIAYKNYLKSVFRLLAVNDFNTSVKIAEDLTNNFNDKDSIVDLMQSIQLIVRDKILIDYNNKELSNFTNLYPKNFRLTGVNDFILAVNKSFKLLKDIKMNVNQKLAFENYLIQTSK